jgi:hypothetical protein
MSMFSTRTYTVHKKKLSAPGYLAKDSELKSYLNRGPLALVQKKL